MITMQISFPMTAEAASYDSLFDNAMDALDEGGDVTAQVAKELGRKVSYATGFANERTGIAYQAKDDGPAACIMESSEAAGHSKLGKAAKGNQYVVFVDSFDDMIPGKPTKIAGYKTWEEARTAWAALV